jgi:hypothetical protein
MKSFKTVSFLVLLSTAAWSAAQNVNLNGTWKAQTTSAQGSAQQTITFQQTGDTFTGEMTTSAGAKEPIKDGKISGDEISFTVERTRPTGEKADVAYKGKITGDEIKGTFTGATGRAVEWSATRQN